VQINFLLFFYKVFYNIQDLFAKELHNFPYKLLRRIEFSFFKRASVRAESRFIHRCCNCSSNFLDWLEPICSLSLSLKVFFARCCSSSLTNRVNHFSKNATNSFWGFSSVPFQLKRERNAELNSAPYQRPSYVRCSTYAFVFEGYLIRLIHTSCFVDVSTWKSQRAISV